MEIINHHLDTWEIGKKFLLSKKLRLLICQLVLEHFFGPQGKEYVQIFDTYSHARLDFLNSPFSFPKWVPTLTSLRHKHSREKAHAALKMLIQQRRQAPVSQPDLLFHFMHIQKPSSPSAGLLNQQPLFHHVVATSLLEVAQATVRESAWQRKR